MSAEAQPPLQPDAPLSRHRRRRRQRRMRLLPLPGGDVGAAALCALLRPPHGPRASASTSAALTRVRLPCRHALCTKARHSASSSSVCLYRSSSSTRTRPAVSKVMAGAASMAPGPCAGARRATAPGRSRACAAACLVRRQPRHAASMSGRRKGRGGGCTRSVTGGWARKVMRARRLRRQGAAAPPPRRCPLFLARAWHSTASARAPLTLRTAVRVLDHPRARVPPSQAAT